MKKIGLALAVLLAASSAAEATDLEFKITGKVTGILDGNLQSLPQVGGYGVGDDFTQSWFLRNLESTILKFSPFDLFPTPGQQIRGTYNYDNISEGINIAANVRTTLTAINIDLCVYTPVPKFFYSFGDTYFNLYLQDGSDILSFLTGKKYDVSYLHYLPSSTAQASRFILEDGNLSISAVTPVPGPELGLGLPALAIVAGFAVWSRRRSAAAA